jgi:hypothetical protein
LGPIVGGAPPPAGGAGAGGAGPIERRGKTTPPHPIPCPPDFGLSKSLVPIERHGKMTLASNQVYKLTGETGSYRFMAPEVFRHEPYNLKVGSLGFRAAGFADGGHQPHEALDLPSP